MKRSVDRILTTHTGSLPRPADLGTLLFDREDGEQLDSVVFDARVRAAVCEAVAHQLESGIDVVGDGEMGKIAYSTYVKDRLTGFEGEGPPPISREMVEFADVFAQTVDLSVLTRLKLPVCTGPIHRRDPDAVATDIDNLTAAIGERQPVEAFLTAASPGVIGAFLANSYYPDEESYLFALAEAMKPEYEAIAGAGFVLQLDCPDLAAFRATGANADRTDEQYRDQIRLHVRALNHAVRDIPPERMRMHVCWGNGEYPHIYDIALSKIKDILLTARPAGLLVEAANPRHEHEWTQWRDIELPDGKVLIPGVIDTTTNFVEHPELVAQRIVRFAELVGRDNVIAGCDCGFGTFTGIYSVDPKVTWLKLAALAEGARLASERLW